MAPEAQRWNLKHQSENSFLVCASVVAFAFVAALSGGCDAAPKIHTLGVNVRGSVSVIPTEFSGYYVYEDANGSEVQRNIRGRGNFSEVVQGRRVTLVSVRRTSTQGMIGLVVTSDGAIVHDTGMLQTSELIVYEDS